MNIFNMVSNVSTYRLDYIEDKKEVFSSVIYTSVMSSMYLVSCKTEEEVVVRTSKELVNILTQLNSIDKVSKEFDSRSHIDCNVHKCVLYEVPVKGLYQSKQLTIANILIRNGFKSYMFTAGNFSQVVIRGVLDEETYVTNLPITISNTRQGRRLLNELVTCGNFETKYLKGVKGALHSILLCKQRV